MGNLNIWLQFIAMLVDSLKLPITASVIAIIILRFRRPLSDLIDRIISFKLGNVVEAVAEPHRELLDVRRETQSIARPELRSSATEHSQSNAERTPTVAANPTHARPHRPYGGGAPESSLDLPRLNFQRLTEIAKTSPNLAVFQSWNHVEEIILRAAEILESSGDRSQGRDVLEAARALDERNLIGDSVTSIIGRMNELRNEAMHNPSFTPDEGFALDFVDVARMILAHIDSAISSQITQ